MECFDLTLLDLCSVLYLGWTDVRANHLCIALHHGCDYVEDNIEALVLQASVWIICPSTRH